MERRFHGQLPARQERRTGDVGDERELERSQATVQLRSAEYKAVREIRQAALQLDQNRQRIETTRVARELSEQRLDAEQKRYDVGMSTNFNVIQAQRDLAVARNDELQAQLDYQLALIAFNIGPEGWRRAQRDASERRAQGRCNRSRRRSRRCRRRTVRAVNNRRSIRSERVSNRPGRRTSSAGSVFLSTIQSAIRPRRQRREQDAVAKVAGRVHEARQSRSPAR